MMERQVWGSLVSCKMMKIKKNFPSFSLTEKSTENKSRNLQKLNEKFPTKQNKIQGQKKRKLSVQFKSSES